MNAHLIAKELTNKKKFTALYCRVSPNNRIENNSIPNQKAILQRYADENGFLNPKFYIDSDYTGLTFHRPAFGQLIDDIQAGFVATVIVKDLSRFGRNHIEAGMYTDIFFLKHDVRFIAISDGVDTINGPSNMAPLINIMNEWSSRDTSNKIRAVNKARALAGESLCTNPPYGYKKNPKKSKSWVIDEPAAEIVRHIFQLSISGLGPSQIAKMLAQEKIVTPTVHFHRQKRKCGNPYPSYLYGWSGGTVSDILARHEYLGHTISFKTYTKSYKEPRSIPNPPEKWVVTENTHPAIIDVDTFNIVQRLRENKRRPMRTGELPMLSGLVVCADCGRKLYFCRGRSVDEQQEHYVCSGYRKNPPKCSIHYIRQVTLVERIQLHLQRILDWMHSDREGFILTIINNSLENHKAQIRLDKTELERLRNRTTELNQIIKQLYEDNVLGKLADERFLIFLADYETEQASLKTRTEILSSKLEKQEMEVMNIDRFMETLEKYAPYSPLTAEIARELVSSVVVYAPDKTTGKRQQHVDIHYNFGVGLLKK